MSEKAEAPQGNLRQGKLHQPQAPEEEHGTRWKTKSLTQNTANPTDRAPLQEQDRQQEPEKVAEPSKCNLRQDTPRKTAGAAGRGTEANSSQWLNNSQPCAEQEERKKTQLLRSSARRAAVKTPKASYLRRWPKCRRGIRSEKATPPVQPGNTSSSAKNSLKRTESPKTSTKTAELGKNRHLGNPAPGNSKNLRRNRQRKQRKRPKKHRTKYHTCLKTKKGTSR